MLLSSTLFWLGVCTCFLNFPMHNFCNTTPIQYLQRALALPCVTEPGVEGVGRLCKLLPQVVIIFLTLSFLAQIILTFLSMKVKFEMITSI